MTCPVNTGTSRAMLINAKDYMKNLRKELREDAEFASKFAAELADVFLEIDPAGDKEDAQNVAKLIVEGMKEK